MTSQVYWTQSHLLNEGTQIVSVLADRKIVPVAIPNFGKVVPQTDVEDPVLFGKSFELVQPKPIITECAMDQGGR
jgi:hypothetical protein